MEKYIYDQNNGLWYKLQGDYYIPCLVLDETDNPSIGMWGRRHLSYLKEHRPVLHTSLVLSGKQMAAQQGVTEQLKALDQMAWVQRMNNIRNAAEEIILQEVIYGEGAV